MARRDAWQQREKMIDLQEAQFALTAAAAIDTHMQLEDIDDALNDQSAQMRVQTGMLLRINEGVEQAERSAGHRHSEAMAEMAKQTRVIAAGNQVLENQGYARWRDGTEPGKFFHYEYRPKALAYLEAYRRMTEVYRASVLIAARTAEKQFIAQYPAPRTPDAALGCPQRPGDLVPVEVPAERSSAVCAVLGCFGGIFAGLFVSFIPVIGLMLPFVLAVAGAVAGYQWAAKQNRDNREPALQENRRRSELDAGYRRALAQWSEVKDDNALRHRQDMEQWSRRRLQYVAQEVGQSFRGDWTGSWSTVQEKDIHRAVSEIVATATENPPAVDNLPRLGSLAINESLDPVYLRALENIRRQLPSI